MHNFDLDFAGRLLFQRLTDSFDRALNITLNDHVKLLDFALFHLFEKILKRDFAGFGDLPFTGFMLTVRGQLLGLFFRFDHVEIITGRRYSTEP